MKLGTKYLMVRSAEGKTVKEFSEMCDFSDKNYGEIERNEKEPNPKSKDKIDRIIRKLGYELLEDGVVKREKTFLSLNGDDRLEKLFEDIDEYVGHGGELLIDGADESKTPIKILDEVRRMRKNGMSMRHLIEEGNRSMRAPIEEYRWMPKELFINQSIFIYKKNVAIFSEKDDAIYIYRDNTLSRYFRNVFNERWAIYKQPDYSDAKDLFDV